MSERNRAIVSYSPIPDSRWYEGRRYETARFFRDQFQPAMSRQIGRILQNDYTNALSRKNDLATIEKGFTALAFGNENVPYGIEIGLNKEVAIVTDNEWHANRAIRRIVHPRTVAENVREIESYAKSNMKDSEVIENFLRFTLYMLERRNRPIVIYGAADSPVLILAIELKKFENMAFSNDFRKYAFIARYYWDKTVGSLFHE